MFGSDLDRLPSRKRLQRFGQFLDRGQQGVADQDRSHCGPTGETGGDLAPHPILRVVESPATLLLGCQPVRSDDGEEVVALGESLGQSVGELLTGADVVVIEPHRPRAVVLAELTVESARVSPRIAPAIADEDPRAGQAALDPGSQSDRSNLLSVAGLAAAATSVRAANASSVSSSLASSSVGPP